MAPPLRGTEILAQPRGLGPIAGQVQDVLQVGTSAVNLAGAIQQKGRQAEKEDFVHDREIMSLFIEDQINAGVAGEPLKSFEEGVLPRLKGRYKRQSTLDVMSREVSESISTGIRLKKFELEGLDAPGRATLNRIVDVAATTAMAPGGTIEKGLDRAQSLLDLMPDLTEEAKADVKNQVNVELERRRDSARQETEKDLYRALSVLNQDVNEQLNDVDSRMAKILKDPLLGGNDPTSPAFDAGLEGMSPATRLGIQRVANALRPELLELKARRKELENLDNDFKTAMVGRNFGKMSKVLSAYDGMLRRDRAKQNQREEPPPDEPEAKAAFDPDGTEFSRWIGGLIGEGEELTTILSGVRKAYAGTDDLERALEKASELVPKQPAKRNLMDAPGRFRVSPPPPRVERPKKIFRPGDAPGKFSRQ